MESTKEEVHFQWRGSEDEDITPQTQPPRHPPQSFDKKIQKAPYGNKYSAQDDEDEKERTQVRHKRQRRQPVSEQHSQSSSDTHAIMEYDESLGNDCYVNVKNEACRRKSSSSSLFHSWLLEEKKDPSSLQTKGRQILQREIQSLTWQLLQVKQQLQPARELCSQAIMNYSNNTRMKTTITPQGIFQAARSASNPMEVLGEKQHGGLNNNMFLNRSAVKMANLDAMLNFSLLSKSCDDGHFVFVDLCGAPGGFSEYLLKRWWWWKEQQLPCTQTSFTTTESCRGYGMSLIGNNEHGQGCPWRLKGCCKRLHRHNAKYMTEYTICQGADGTGDLYQWDNVVHLRNNIRRDLVETAKMDPSRKVDLVVADGGFDAQRESDCQESLSQKLVLCEMAAGLELLRKGGTLIVKLFGCQTASIRAAMRFLFAHFARIQLLKPISSRPASQERYAVFQDFAELPPSWKGGPAWMSSILLEKLTSSRDCQTASASKYEQFEEYLDRVDRDMMALNLKACIDILSTMSTWKSNRQQLVSTNRKQRRKLANLYKQAWKLQGMEKQKLETTKKSIE